MKSTITINGTTIEYDYYELLEAVKEANKKAWTCRGCQYSVYLWNDGTITDFEDIAGSNSWLAAEDAHCVMTLCHRHDNLYDIDVEWREDTISRLSDAEEDEYERILDEEGRPEADDFLLNTSAYEAHSADLIEWLGSSTEDLEFDLDAQLERLDDSYWA